jgi:hypothetical protein
VKTRGQKESQKHEKRLAKTLGGSTVAASGAFWSRKGDVRSEKYLVEHKFTDAKSYSLKAEDLVKLEKQAIMAGRIPLFAVALGGKNYFILLEDDYLAETGDDL